MRFSALLTATFGVIACVVPALSQTELGATHVTPNLIETIDRPLRYRPDSGDFVIQNGSEFFNRPLYGGNTAFRVDGGDKPEFVLYLPGRGGNLRLGVRNAAAGVIWLHQAAHVETRYRPGELIHEVRDPVFGEHAAVRLASLAYSRTEGLVVRVTAEGVAPGTELIWAYGGINGQRGKRDGDIGTESVPISEWFQLRPDFCRGNTFERTATGFIASAKPAVIAGVVPPGSQLLLGNSALWNDPRALLESAVNLPRDGTVTTSPSGDSLVVVGRVPLTQESPLFLSLQRIRPESARTPEGGASGDLETYRAVTAPGIGDRPPRVIQLAAHFAAAELPDRFAEAERHFADLRQRVTVDTPDAFLNAAVGALNVAADAVWDESQQVIMHGAIAWRTKLLGWRGPYALDALGWHDRARQNITYWAGRQNVAAIPQLSPPPDERANLARNEAGLHTNGDLSNSHYDMNLVFIDALFRHLQWTGDLAFARQVWPVIERHLAWERRLFRREFGPQKLPLYEAYAAIWASDDLQYSGGGVMHASAYNYHHNRQAARLARLIGADPAAYEHEAKLLFRSMRELLWVVPDSLGTLSLGGNSTTASSAPDGWFAECKDWLGLQRVHPRAALWTFYHTVDSEVPAPVEAWKMTRQVEAQIPRIPVRGPGVPDGMYTLSTSNWMPYDWSINNVVMAEAVHAALAHWQAGRPDKAWAIAKGSLVAAMFMGISPGNVGSMSYLDVYRRESQRDFADGSGVLSRALIEGLFGVKPDLLAGELRVQPGWPEAWAHAELRHPDVSLRFERDGDLDRYSIEQRFATPQKLRLVVAAPRDDVAGIVINGNDAPWQRVDGSVGMPRIEIVAAAAQTHDVRIRWAGEPIRGVATHVSSFEPRTQGTMRWLQPPSVEPVDSDVPFELRATRQPDATVVVDASSRFEPIDLEPVFNDRVTQIFRNEYRSPRSPFVSLALPKQGIGGWAGGLNKTVVIDDSGLRAAAGRGNGRIILPNGVPFVTPVTSAANNILFTSQWENYPREKSVPLSGRARGLYLVMAGSTNPMQSHFENGELVVTYVDGSITRLPLVNPINWWPIEQDYFIDDFQFRRVAPLPTRIDLKTGRIRMLEHANFKGRGGAIVGGAATILTLSLDSGKDLKSLTVRATANDVVIGLMAGTLIR